MGRVIRLRLVLERGIGVLLRGRCPRAGHLCLGLMHLGEFLISFSLLYVGFVS